MIVESPSYANGRFALLDDLIGCLTDLDIPPREQAHLYAILELGTIKHTAILMDESRTYMSHVLSHLAEQVHDKMRKLNLAKMLPENYYYLLLMEIFQRQSAFQLEDAKVIKNFLQILKGPVIKLGQTQHIICTFLSNGYTISQIAHLIDLPLQTVKNSASEIYQAFGISEVYPTSAYKSIAAGFIYHHYSDYIR